MSGAASLQKHLTALEYESIAHQVWEEDVSCCCTYMWSSMLDLRWIVLEDI